MMLRKAGIDPGEEAPARAKLDREYFPQSKDQFWTHYSGKRGARQGMQRYLSHRVYFQEILRSGPDSILPASEVAPLLDEVTAASTPPDPVRNATSLIFTTRPTTSATHISNKHFWAALRHRLNLPPAHHLPRHCISCSKPLTPSHFHSCPKQKKKGVHDRHELIANELILQAKRAGLVAARMPPLYDEKTGKRKQPDIKILAHTGTVFVDVSVCCGFAESNLPANNPHPIRTRELAKAHKYRVITKHNSARFIAFVVDSLGRFGEGAWDLLSLFVSAHNDIHTDDACESKHLLDSLARTIAILIQRGNGAVDAAALALYPDARPDPPSIASSSRVRPTSAYPPRHASLSAGPPPALPQHAPQ